MMTELSLNLLDIAQNSVKAGASVIELGVEAYSGLDLLILSVRDNGCGMDEQTLLRVTDPFSTSRTTRKVGLGVPFFKQAAEAAGGAFSISSRLGAGTSVLASFRLTSIDRMPMGDMTATVLALITGAEDSDIRLRYCVDWRLFEFSTSGVRSILGEVPLNEPEVALFIRDYLSENIRETDGEVAL